MEAREKVGKIKERRKKGRKNEKERKMDGNKRFKN